MLPHNVRHHHGSTPRNSASTMHYNTIVHLLQMSLDESDEGRQVCCEVILWAITYWDCERLDFRRDMVGEAAQSYETADLQLGEGLRVPGDSGASCDV